MSSTSNFEIENGVLKWAFYADGDVVIPEGVTELADKVFRGKKLTSVTLPQSLRKIGFGAFGNVLPGAVIVLPKKSPVA